MSSVREMSTTDKSCGYRAALIAGICFLFFLGIPIRVKKNSVDNEEVLFENYIEKFNKSYNKNDIEYLIRFENFRKSLRLIEELNKNNSGDHSAVYGLAVFSDLSQDEFVRNRLQTNVKQLQQSYSEYSDYLTHNTVYATRNDVSSIDNFKERLKRSTSVPLKVDWREKGVIGKVHNQKTCGACWAFSTIETIEAMNALKNRSLVELSVQEAVDCAQGGNYGCQGGDSCSLLHWLLTTKTKITTEKLYPFTYETGFCKVKNPKTGVQITSYTCNNFVGLEDQLVRQLALHGPAATAVNALNWQYYLGGIIQYHCAGAPQSLNHAVQIVGYDRTGPVPYYIARNSWGTEFGDKGYIYIAIGGNVCGIANQVSAVDVL